MTTPREDVLERLTAFAEEARVLHQQNPGGSQLDALLSLFMSRICELEMRVDELLQRVDGGCP